ncbi:MAG: cobalamin biosynthesis protein P47K [Acidobacteria bacterium]|nr:cobalamin biosynthesis protein P47K [Acidobacteriota bacterium]
MTGDEPQPGTAAPDGAPGVRAAERSSRVRARYVMVGGFLGAGKTTAIVRLARLLTDRGRRVGLITNDQSVGLVDTTLARAQGFPVEEITGGCFCCRFNTLMEAADRLNAEARPDVFLAEPVGSCTDLRAAVSYPLRRMYGDAFEIAPLSVLVDPLRALRVLGLEAGRSFSRKVLYVYDRQLAEADVIVVNKVDLLDAARLGRLRDALAERYPQAEVLAMSAREGTGLEPWVELVTRGSMGLGAAPDVDYDTYAEGEALLGWLNATVRVRSAAPFDGNALLRELAAAMADAVGAGEIAHLKMTLTADELPADIAVLNLVAEDRGAELAHTLKAPVDAAELIVNLRAEHEPLRLREAALAALVAWEAAGRDRRAEVEHVEHFRPARPTPTYRLATA